MVVASGLAASKRRGRSASPLDGAAESFHASGRRVFMGTFKIFTISTTRRSLKGTLSVYITHMCVSAASKYCPLSHSYSLRQRNNVYSSARAALAAFSFAEQV